MRKVVCRLWLGFLFLFLYAPIMILAVYSFTKSTMIGRIRGFSLENYVTLFTTEELIHMILGTVALALVVSFISTVLGTAGAIGVHYGNKKNRKALEFFNQIPVVNADVVTGFSVCILLIVFLRIPKDSFIPLVIGLCVLCTPFVYLSVMPRLKSMDPHLYEAALDLGATPKTALFKVVIKELMPGILSGFLTSITLTVDDYFITTTRAFYCLRRVIHFFMQSIPFGFIHHSHKSTPSLSDYIVFSRSDLRPSEILIHHNRQ